MAFTCPLCAKISPSAKGMGNHFTRFHSMKSEQLAHHFHVPTTCECGSPGRFLSLTRGYTAHCAACETRVRSDSAKRAKARLKADPVAYALFRQRTSTAVSAQWQEDQSARVANMSRGIQATVDAMTNEERCAKFGWMNAPHVTPEKKREVWEKSLKKWYDEASREQLDQLSMRRAERIIKSTKHSRVYDNNLPEEHTTNVWAFRSKALKCSDALNELFQTEVV